MDPVRAPSRSAAEAHAAAAKLADMAEAAMSAVLQNVYPREFDARLPNQWHIRLRGARPPFTLIRLLDNPLTIREELRADVSRFDDPRWFTLDGELPPGSEGNPTDKTAWVDILEREVPVDVLEDGTEILRLRFGGRRLRGMLVVNRKLGQAFWEPGAAPVNEAIHWLRGHYLEVSGGRLADRGSRRPEGLPVIEGPPRWAIAWEDGRAAVAGQARGVAWRSGVQGSRVHGQWMLGREVAPNMFQAVGPVGMPAESRQSVDGLAFTDRYAELGMQLPDPAAMCAGQCEGTGWLPVFMLPAGGVPEGYCVGPEETEPALIDLWRKAEEERHAADGWHFVPCPGCGGSGLARGAESMTPEADGWHGHPHGPGGEHRHPWLGGTGGHAHEARTWGGHRHDAAHPMEGFHLNAGDGIHDHPLARGLRDWVGWMVDQHYPVHKWLPGHKKTLLQEVGFDAEPRASTYRDWWDHVLWGNHSAGYPNADAHARIFIEPRTRIIRKWYEFEDGTRREPTREDFETEGRWLIEHTPPEMAARVTESGLGRIAEFKIDGYEASKATDAQLADDWRLLAAKWATMRSGGRTEFSDELAIVDFAAKVVSEIRRRGRMEFRREEQKPRTRELLARVERRLREQDSAASTPGFLDSHDVHVSSLPNIELVSMHGWIHSEWDLPVETHRWTADQRVAFHRKVAAELATRGLEHRPKTELDALSGEAGRMATLPDAVASFDRDLCLRDPFLAVVGGTAVSGRGRDLDVWVNWPEDDAEFLRVLAFRLQSALPPDVRLNLIADPRGPFTNYMPFARLIVRVTPPSERELMQMSLGPVGRLTADARRDAEASEREDAVRPFRFYAHMKPQAGVRPGDEFSPRSVFKYIRREDYPLRVEPKFDGLYLQVHKVGGRLEIFKEGGERVDLELMPTTADELAEQPADFVAEFEAELFLADEHRGRSEVSGYLARSRAEPALEMHLRLTAHDVLWLNGKDVHRTDLVSAAKFLDAIKPGKSVRMAPHGLANTEAEALALIEKFRRWPSEGAVLKSGAHWYSLDGRPSRAMTKFKNTADLVAEVVGRDPVEDSPGVWNYRVGLRDRRGRLVPVGTTFNTGLEVKAGGLIRLNVETLHRWQDPESGRVWYAAVIPKAVEEADYQERPDSLETADAVNRQTGGERGQKQIPPEWRSVMAEAVRAAMTQVEASRVRKRDPAGYPVGFYRIQTHYRGKSLADYSPLVVRKDGRIVVCAIEDLWPDDATCDEAEVHGLEVWSYSGWEPILRVYRHRLNDGERLKRIRTADGFIDVTGDHSLFRDGKPIPARSIKVGDRVDEVANLPELEGVEAVDPEFAWACGFYLAEGSNKDGKSAEFTQKDPGPLRRIQRWAWRYGLRACIMQESGSKMWRLELSRLRIWHDFYARRMNVMEGRAARRKKVPEWVFSWGKEGQEAFIDGYLAGDGIGYKEGRLEFGTISQELAQGVLLILRRLRPNLSPRTTGQQALLRMRMSDASRCNAISTAEAPTVREILESCNADFRGKRNPRHDNKGYAVLWPGPSRFIYSWRRFVYDIETPSHSFVGGVGKILAHNSSHKDFRFKAGPDFLEGWTLADEPSGEITSDVDDLDDGYRWQGAVRWKFRPDMEPGAKVVAVPKARQPLQWINVFNVVVPAGRVGGTAEEEGVFTLVDEGRLWRGMSKPTFREYFLDGEIFRGRLVFRLVPTAGFERPSSQALQWQAATNLQDDVPTILGARERRKPREEQYVPKDGEPAIPLLPVPGVAVHAGMIPEELRWWSPGLEAGKRLERLDAAFNHLVERGVLAARPLAGAAEAAVVGDAREARPRFLLRAVFWRGQLVVRGLPVLHYDLMIEREDGPVEKLTFTGGENPVDALAAGAGGIAAVRSEVRSSNLPPGADDPAAWLEPKKLELPPGHPENPTKELPLFVEPVDHGPATVIHDGPTSFKLELKGSKLDGVFVLTRGSPSDEVWVLRRSEGPVGRVDGLEAAASSVTRT